MGIRKRSRCIATCNLPPRERSMRKKEKDRYRQTVLITSEDIAPVAAARPTLGLVKPRGPVSRKMTSPSSRLLLSPLFFSFREICHSPSARSRGDINTRGGGKRGGVFLGKHPRASEIAELPETRSSPLNPICAICEMQRVSRARARLPRIRTSGGKLISFRNPSFSVRHMSYARRCVTAWRLLSSARIRERPCRLRQPAWKTEM